MKGGNHPHPVAARTLFRFCRVALVFVLLSGLNAVVSGPSRAEDLSAATHALFEAVERNDFGTVRSAIADGAMIEARDPFGMRPVDLAIDRGHYRIAHYLLSLRNAREAASAATEPVPPAGPAILPAPAEFPSGGATALPPPPPDAESAATVVPPVSDIGVQVPPLSADAADREPSGAGDVSDMPDETSSRIGNAVHAFDEAFDTFLGGWFFKWVSRKMGWASEAEARDHEIAADQEVSDAAASAPSTASSPADPPAPEVSASIPPRDVQATLPEATPEPVPPAGAESPAATAAVMTESTPPFTSEADSQPVVSPPATDPELAADSPAESSSAMSATADAANAQVEPRPEIAMASPPPSSRVPPASVDAPSPPAADPTPSAPAVAAIEPFASDPVEEKIPSQPAIAVSPPSSSRAPPASMVDADPVPSASAVAHDPFAPDAVAPGARHPIIADRPAVSPHSARVEPAPPPSPVRRAPAAAAAPAPLKPPPADRVPVAEKRTAQVPSARGSDVSAKAPRMAAVDGSTRLLDQLAGIPETASPPSKGPEPRLFGLEGPADVTHVAAVPTAVVPPASPRKLPDAVLTLGESVQLSAATPPEPEDPGERNFCVRKNRGAVVFCVEPVDWPTSLAPQMQVSSIMYQGAQAIVRYDDGMATRIHAIFPTASFAALADYYTRRFGKPTATGQRTIAPFAQPRQKNQVVSWQRTDPLTRRRTTLEICKFDDTRGGFPDLRHGAIVLYDAASPPIFPVLSTLDLMPTSISR